MNIELKKSESMKIKLFDYQIKQISLAEDIERYCKHNDIIAFDVFDDGILVGFAMLRKYDLGKWFLWNYAIDKNHQGRGLGKVALLEIISLMKEEYNLTELTTTYIYENDIAGELYTKMGFEITDIVDEKDCHEVNMLLRV